MSTYWQINLAALSLPLLFSFHPRFPFYRHWKSFVKGCLLTAIPFLIWDVVFTQLGVWGFNDLHLGHTRWFGMPIEEYAFFFCIPYACVFTFFSFKCLFSKWSLHIKWIYALLAVALLLVAFWQYQRLYTVITFASMGVFAVVLLLTLSNSDLTLMLATYLFTLVPFAIVNGFLTGSWIEEEVVWYNNLENLGLRLGTIPVEDTMYGMLLIFMNIVFFEFFRNRSSLRDYGLST